MAPTRVLILRTHVPFFHRLFRKIMSQRRRGRPPKWSPKIGNKIIRALRKKATRKAAYTAAGISHDTFALWIRTKPDFAQAVREATESEERQRLNEQVEELIRRNAERRDFEAFCQENPENPSPDLLDL
jgi:hypothetical protein